MDIKKRKWILNKKKELESIGKDHRFPSGVGEGTLSDIVSLSAVELSDAIKDKVVSCVDVMQSYLAQIDKVNPTFNAIVSLRNRDELISEAAQKDSELAKGIYHGWMHGFPHAVKDLAATEGIPTTMGSSLLANEIKGYDAIFVERGKNPGPEGQALGYP